MIKFQGFRQQLVFETMSRFRKGMVVRTSYGTGPYEITEVSENCTCPSFLDSLNCGCTETPPRSKPHCHIVCRRFGEKRDNYYLNGYDENGVCVWSDNDRLIVCEEETMFLSMCCG